MTDIKLIPSRKILEERAAEKRLLIDNKNIADVLFENADCLTANVLNDPDLFPQRWQAEQAFKKDHPGCVCYTVDGHAPLSLFYWHYFQYFSNGVLVHRYMPSQQKKYLKYITDMLAWYGCDIKKVYGPKNALEERAYRDVFLSIAAKIKKTYPQKAQFAVAGFSSAEDFVEKSFANGNILLTAAATENIPPEYRKILALFSNGLFCVSDEYKGDLGPESSSPITRFMREHSYFVYLAPVLYVPRHYIEALYEKAAAYDWFAPKETVRIKQPELSAKQKETMRAETDVLFEKSKCLCVTNPRAPFNDVLLEPGKITSPEDARYALFDDGTLLLSNALYGERAESTLLLKTLHECFPQMDFHKRLVPDHYITHILREMEQRQKKAADIYIEMLKRKAKKLKKIYGIKHHEALDLTAMLAGWQNWKAVSVSTEEQARFLIAREQDTDYRDRNRQTLSDSVRILQILEKMNVRYSYQEPFDDSQKK